jgi:glycine cleavage system aminomethyltransferase T
VAGVSCMVLQRPLLGHECRQIWVDNTYARYLWETLLAIGHEHSGRAVGLGPFVESRPHEG